MLQKMKVCYGENTKDLAGQSLPKRDCECESDCDSWIKSAIPALAQKWAGVNRSQNTINLDQRG